TTVFGLACSAGAGADVATTIMYDKPVVTCGTTEFALDPRTDEGNADVTVDGHTLHYGVYRGTEQLQCGTDAQGVAVSCNKVYWNLAIDLEDLAGLGP